MQCYTCGGYGHSQRNCPTQRSNSAQTNEYNNQGYSDEYDYTSGFGAINMMITVLEDNCEYPATANATSSQAHCSKLDSCCTRHMTGFYALKNAHEHKVAVIFGNQQKLYSTHVGTLVLSNGIELTDCLFVPGLMWTLISEPRIEMDGGSMTSSKGVRHIFDSDGKIMIIAHMDNHTYLLDKYSTRVSYSEASNYAVADAKYANTADLWHCRLGHLNFQDMQKHRDTRRL